MNGCVCQSKVSIVLLGPRVLSEKHILILTYGGLTIILVELVDPTARISCHKGHLIRRLIVVKNEFGTTQRFSSIMVVRRARVTKSSSSQGSFIGQVNQSFVEFYLPYVRAPSRSKAAEGNGLRTTRTSIKRSGAF